MKTIENLIDENLFHSLGPDFYSEVQPSGILNPVLVSASEEVARLVGLDPAQLGGKDFVRAFSGHSVLPRSKPVAMVYAGHQFGGYTPRLGDGRSLLIGNSVSASGSYELSIKGAGLTPYSRFADGRAVLRSSIREYLCSEAMAGLGIPTTRALCVIHGEDEVFREEIEPSATVVRVSESHVRFGNFEYFYHMKQDDQVKALADYVVANFYPHITDGDDAERYARFLSEVSERTARMIAKWQVAGFAHGVMNTDNMSIVGETLDYGPFGFMEEYDPGYICNHSDHTGRYAFNQQPQIGLWNLNALAQCFTGFVDIPLLRTALEKYEPVFIEEFAKGLRAKLGLRDELEEDFELIDEIMNLLTANRVDYTIFFRRLCDFRAGGENKDVRDLFIDRNAFDVWAAKYSARLSKQGGSEEARAVEMRKHNPKYILRNYMAQLAIEKAHDSDYSEVNRLLDILGRPFEEQPENEEYAGFSPDWGKDLSISCSS